MDIGPGCPYGTFRMVTKEDRERRTRVGFTLRAAREAAGLSQAELARAAGLPRQHVCDTEQGRRGVSLARLERFAKALGVPVGDLLA